MLASAVLSLLIIFFGSGKSGKDDDDGGVQPHHHQTQSDPNGNDFSSLALLEERNSKSIFFAEKDET